jgi:hypothetical protein
VAEGGVFESGWRDGVRDPFKKVRRSELSMVYRTEASGKSR